MVLSYQSVNVGHNVKFIGSWIFGEPYLYLERETKRLLKEGIVHYQ